MGAGRVFGGAADCSGRPLPTLRIEFALLKFQLVGNRYLYCTHAHYISLTQQADSAKVAFYLIR